MKFRPFIAALVSPALIVACGETQTEPTTDLLRPSFDGASGCFTPQFNVVAFGPGSCGPRCAVLTFTGDLEGSYEVEFDVDQKFTGGTVANGGVADWDVTGGIAGPLTFSTRFDNRYRTAKPPPLRLENNGTHRAVDGVQIANLTYHGFLDALTGEINFAYHGVLCP